MLDRAGASKFGSHTFGIARLHIGVSSLARTNQGDGHILEGLPARLLEPAVYAEGPDTKLLLKSRLRGIRLSFHSLRRVLYGQRRLPSTSPPSMHGGMILDILLARVEE